VAGHELTDAMRVKGRGSRHRAEAKTSTPTVRDHHPHAHSHCSPRSGRIARTHRLMSSRCRAMSGITHERVRRGMRRDPAAQRCRHRSDTGDPVRCDPTRPRRRAIPPRPGRAGNATRGPRCELAPNRTWPLKDGRSARTCEPDRPGEATHVAQVVTGHQGFAQLARENRSGNCDCELVALVERRVRLTPEPWRLRPCLTSGVTGPVCRVGGGHLRSGSACT
jgi:hypothetical protein